MTLKRQSTSLSDGRRIVVKIGSSLLVEDASGHIRRRWLDALAEDVFSCREQGQEILIVSSGAIAVGRRHVGRASGSLRLHEKQAAAATGMVRLAHAFQEVLGHHGLTIAQILLTLDDTEDRRRYINARNTLATLLKWQAVPLINENDTVATDEIRFGDNDRLAARVAAMVSADTLILLSDVDGLYTADPSLDPSAEFIPKVTQLTPAIEAMGGGALPGHSTGGMTTKLAAAKIAMGAGCRMVITNGHDLHPLRRIKDGTPCTWFLPSASPQAARKRWIAGTVNPAGTVIVDQGAERALALGKSLLPAGVIEIEGDFARGAAVNVQSRDGRNIGKGLIAYAAKDARCIMGCKTSEIESYLGYRGQDEIIHRDDLVFDRGNTG